ncbi:hypothetical protein UlMin_006734 [Ulmus minor]
MVKRSHVIFTFLQKNNEKLLILGGILGRKVRVRNLVSLFIYFKKETHKTRSHTQTHLPFFLYIHDITKKLLAKFRFRNRPQTQAKRHFAEKAIALDPNYVAAHILKALAFNLLGFKTSALDSLEVALSPLGIKSLREKEKRDSLVKRAELKMAIRSRRKVDSILGDLAQAVLFSSDNVKAFCYKVKKMVVAKKAYQEESFCSSLFINLFDFFAL